MPDRAMIDTVKTWTEAGKNLFAVLRDGLLFVLLMMLVGCPRLINDRLVASGVTTVDGPGFHWERQVEKSKQDTLKAAAAVESTQSQNVALLAKIDAIVAANPSLGPQLAPLRASVQRSDRALDGANTQLASSIAGQQTILSNSPAVSTPPLVGWMYLGAVDEQKGSWQNGRRTTDVPWPVDDGTSATVTDDAYVRLAGATNARSAGAPIGVAKRGKIVQIDQITSSGHLKGGGWTVWAHVSVPQ